MEWIAISLVFKKNNTFFLFIYFFHAGPSLLSRLIFGYGGQKVFSSCGPLASHCSGFSCFRVWALEHVGFSNCGPSSSEKAMAPHSSTFAWKIPWTEEPGRLQSMGSLESDMTERLHFHFSLSCIGGGNGNPLQCSCLENPRDGGAWWAAVYGVTQSQTRLK